MSDEHKQMRIDAGLVRELAELLSANELSEIEVEDGDRKIRVRRELTVAAAPVSHVVAAPAQSVMPAQAGGQVADAQAPAAAEPAGDLVRSPMVGTCYLAAEPGSAPFVGVGDTVKEGDTLLIVEAMKVMNPIVAPRGGRITQLLVANAQPVEFDQPLVVIE
jgi:acetyl-CoA carboxylase biotin carboxyl carrier protein